MRECDIWADREPGSCGGAPEKSPLKPFVLFSLEKKERLGDLALCVSGPCFIATWQEKK